MPPFLFFAPELDAALERRTTDRSATDGRAAFIARSGRTLRVELVDLSEDGVGVWCGEPAECGSPAAFTLPARRSSRSLRIDATVVECRVAAPGVWRLGFRFVRRLDALELASCLP